MKGLKFYEPQIARAVGFLKARNIKRTQIYLQDSDEFIVAFFACLASDLRPLVLSSDNPQEGLFLIDDLTEILGEPSEFKIVDEAKFYLKTSGSSGEPKMIEKSVKQMKLEASALANKFNFGGEFLASVSHQHMFGLTFKIFLPLVLGAKIYPKFLNYPEFVFDKDLNGRTLITSPTILKTLLDNPRRELLSALKNIVCAGGKLENELRDKILTLTEFINIYGSTETGVVASDVKDGLVLFSEVSASICEDGCLNVCSPWCESFKTSDLAEISGRNLTLLGRFDRTLKINEKRISLDEVEIKIKSHELIEDCVCGEAEGLERISAAVKLSRYGAKAFRDIGKIGIVKILRDYLRSDFSNNVRHFKIVSNIERDAQGKFKKTDFNELWKAREILKFTTTKLSDKTGNFSAKIETGLFYFDGHFGDFPLVPGFVQLESVVNLARNFGLNLDKSPKFEAVKFTNFLRPNDTADFELEVKNGKLYFVVKNGEKICANGRICID